MRAQDLPVLAGCCAHLLLVQPMCQPPDGWRVAEFLLDRRDDAVFTEFHHLIEDVITWRIGRDGLRRDRIATITIKEVMLMLPWLSPSALISPEMFHLGLPVAEKMLRPIIVYVFLVAALRVFGKRELAQLNPFDLVVLLSLSNTVQNAIIGDDNSVAGGLIGAFTLLAVNYLVVRFLFRHRRLDQMIEGRPAVLIERGKINTRALAKELLTESELLTVAHRQGFKSLREIDRCVLDPGGIFFIEGKAPPLVERQHAELLAQLEQINQQLGELRRQAPPC
jgi:uncharacterized membrane protein YcaP (DUF421 family)